MGTRARCKALVRTALQQTGLGGSKGAPFGRGGRWRTEFSPLEMLDISIYIIIARTTFQQGPKLNHMEGDFSNFFQRVNPVPFFKRKMRHFATGMQWDTMGTLTLSSQSIIYKHVDGSKDF